MFDYTNFISKKKSLLIAPAGYGKTHTIAECLNYVPANEKQLILTHTHAGIASIKEKIKHLNVPTSKYQLETITSFAQKYVLAFCNLKELPDQDNSKEYYSFILEKASQLFKLKSVQRIVSSTYKGLFVDEYQDCTKQQHSMVLALSEILPTHLLGDPLQGIMNFNGDLVDFEVDLTEFETVPELDTPYRWFKEGNNKKLGEALKEIRSILTSDHPSIDLSNFNGNGVLYLVKIRDDNDLYNFSSTYSQDIRKLITSNGKRGEFNNMLIITPEYLKGNIPKGNVTDRAKVKSLIDFEHKLALIEAIDEKSFYVISKKIDNIISTIKGSRNPIKKLCTEILEPLFKLTDIKNWIDISGNRLKGKRNPTDKLLSNELRVCIENFLLLPSLQNLKAIILFLKNKLRFKSSRNDLLKSIIKALDIAIVENQSVYESMVSYKNVIRRTGRKLHGKCIGTTALTKGLEFDTVVILGAHNFTCPKNFYVAITRASKVLIIFTKEEQLTF